MTHRSLPQAFAWTLVLAMFAFGCSSSSNTDDKIECLTALRINCLLYTSDAADDDYTV